MTRSRISALTAHAQTLFSCLKQAALVDRLPSSLERYLVKTKNGTTSYNYSGDIPNSNFLGYFVYKLQPCDV